VLHIEIESRLKRRNHGRVAKKDGILVIVLFGIRGPVVAAREKESSIENSELIMQDCRRRHPFASTESW